MMFALYAIGATVALVLMSARLREVHAELARVRTASDERAKTLESEYAAYAHGLTMTLAVLMSMMGAWPAPHTTRRDTAGSREENETGESRR